MNANSEVSRSINTSSGLYEYKILRNECGDELSKTSVKNTFKPEVVPDHCGIKGKREIDELPRTGLNTDFIGIF